MSVTDLVQFQPSPEARGCETPGGRVSGTVTRFARSGRALLTWSVHVIVWPASTGSRSSPLVIERSAPSPDAVTAVPSVSELLEVLGSEVVDVTAAVLLRGPLAGAVAVIVMSGAVATPRLGRVHVRTPATGAPPGHPLPEATT